MIPIKRNDRELVKGLLRRIRGGHFTPSFLPPPLQNCTPGAKPRTRRKAAFQWY
jgi:hypothetical protein